MRRRGKDALSVAKVARGEAEPRSGRKRPRNKNVSDVVAFDGLLAAHYEYAPFGKTIVDTSGNEDAHHGPSWDEWRRENGKSETDKELW